MKQYEDFSYDQLPSSWMFCFRDECPKAEECILHLSGKFIPKDMEWGRAIFPTAVKANGCSHFKKIRKIHAAYGFKKLFEEVKRKDDKPLRDRMKEYLGSQKTYYRYNSGERLLTPEQQQWIISLFNKFGYTENLEFDHYCYVYDFS